MEKHKNKKLIVLLFTFNQEFLKKSQIHYSGPLLPSGGNLDEMLKEHERQIQNAVRKARGDKKKSSGSNIQTQSLLSYGPNGR